MKAFTLFVAVCVIIVTSHTALADSNNPWFVNGPISSTKAELYSLKDSKYIYLESQDHCLPIIIQNNQGYLEECAVQAETHMAYGSRIYLANTTRPHYFYDPTNTNAIYQPIPKQSYIIQQVGKTTSAKLKIIYDAYSFNEGIRYSNDNTPQVYINNKQTQTVWDKYANAALQSELGHSSGNGQWYVGQNGRGVYKINLTTLELQYIRQGLYTTNGISPRVKMAISDDGKTIAYYSGQRGIFEVIDTNDCQNSIASTGSAAKCEAKNIMPFITGAFSEKLPELDIDRIEFYKNDVLSMYVYTFWDKALNDYTAQRLFLNAGEDSLDLGTEYIAMGDSFASGEGAYSYKEGTDEPLNKCHLSAKSYPFLLEAMGVVGGAHSVACSGARMKDVIDINSKKYSDDSQQSLIYNEETDLELIINNYYTGSTRQINFIETYRPKNITISISGNDIGFGDIVKKCVALPTDCYQSYEERAQIVNIVNAQYGNLVKTLREIKQTASIDSRIYALGYPKVAVSEGNCANNVRLSNNEIIFSNQLVEHLNSVVEMASRHVGVYYVDVEEAFVGYRLCENSSSAVAVNGLTAGNDSFITNLGPLGQESYHPNKKGHELYAEAIKNKTASFTAGMPLPNPGNPYTINNEEISLFEGFIETPKLNYSAHYEPELAADLMVKDSPAALKLSGDKYNIAPNSELKVVAYSNPTNLGSYFANAYGDLDALINIPSSLEPGYHTIHVTGTNLFGETFDIQKIVYVAASQNDFDGDGILNASEKCLVGDPAGVDIDGDDIDDACDGYIGTAKINTNNTTSQKDEINDESEWLGAIPTVSVSSTPTAPNASATILSVANNGERQNNVFVNSPAGSEQVIATPQNMPNTTVAGVSSAVEASNMPINNQRWFNYILPFLALGFIGLVISAYYIRKKAII